MLPAIIATRREGFIILYFPPMPDMPLNQIEGLEFRFMETLQDVIESFSGQLTVFSDSPITEKASAKPMTVTHDKDFEHVIGHEKAKRALEIAPAGATMC